MLEIHQQQLKTCGEGEVGGEGWVVEAASVFLQVERGKGTPSTGCNSK